MSKKPNSVAIGAFIMGAIVIAVAVVLLVSGSGIGQDRDKVVMVFDGSVKGLSVGAPVALRGVEIGQVSDIDLIFDTDTIDVIMIVEAEIRSDNIQRRGHNEGDYIEEMIARGLRAQLNTQSLLTGLLYIQMDFHPNSDLILVAIDLPYRQIPTIPTDLQRFSREFESVDFSALASNLQTMADGLTGFVTDEGFQQLPETLHATLVEIKTLSAKLNLQIDTSGPKLNALLDNATTTFESANNEIPRLSTSAVNALSSLERTLANFGQTLEEVDYLIADDSSTRYQLDKALKELALAGRAIQLLAKTLEEQPEALLRGRKEDKP
ncbi:MAG: MlaD family protein [Halioglobus sp.]